MPFMYATSNVILEARLTAARAAALDELLPANIPTDLANIEADTAGLAGAAMRGTDGVPTTRPFTMYAYGPTFLANNASFVPPTRTIVFAAWIDAVPGAIDDWFFHCQNAISVNYDAFLQPDGNDKFVMTGNFLCNGVAGFKQATGADKEIILMGLTMAA